MIKKGTKLYSILKFKCPHCQEGRFFKAHPYNLAKAGDIYDNCPICEQKYSKEPGFYFGAMYVSYGFEVAIFVANYVAVTIFVDEASISTYLIAIAVTVIGSAPLVYALSKIVWANMFFSYDEKLSKNRSI